jgi:GST-like protein
MSPVGTYKLLGQAGWGSALAEAALTLAERPFVFEAVEVRGTPAEREALTRYNALCEVPTLVLPSGKVMTESAAIMLHLADVAPGAGLVPLAAGERRDEFLRWLAFLVAAIYPTFTYGDVPSRYVSGKTAEDDLVASTDAARQRYWSLFEAAITPSPWALGDFTALDIYVTVMVHWRPGRSWFKASCPKLDAIAERGLALPKLKGVWEHNKFPSPA